MAKFDFLTTYLAGIPEDERRNYRLRAGIDEGSLAEEGPKARIDIPEDLKEFYAFSYGAVLDEYRILTFEEICQELPQLRSTYGDLWNDNLLPFAKLMGVGDIIALDISDIRNQGTLVLDGFHELPPSHWKSICYGIRTWLKKMTESGFRPFWLTDNEEDFT